jgi:hypothetical protein
MAFVVVYDACVLHPAPLRDLLLRVAGTGLFRAKWTEEILAECFDSILRNRPDLDPGRLARTRQLMIDSVPDCLVRNYEGIINGLALPDPQDRHVLAAAIRAGAQTIVTSNLKDFPSDVLVSYDVVAQHPDEFLLHVLDLSPPTFLKVLEEQAGALRNPAVTLEELLAKLDQIGLGGLVAEVRRHAR